MKVLRPIVELHAEEAAFLWSVRRSAATAHHYRHKDVVALDGRLEANLEGLALSGELGWEVYRAQLDPEEPGTALAQAQGHTSPEQKG